MELQGVAVAAFAVPAQRSLATLYRARFRAHNVLPRITDEGSDETEEIFLSLCGETGQTDRLSAVEAEVLVPPGEHRRRG